MDEIKIMKGIILTPLKKINHPRGDIFHGMKRSDDGFFGFGEAYFSTVKNNDIKGWNRHKIMTLNLIVPVGCVTFVIYDDRIKSDTKGEFYKIDLSQDSYKRLTVPPGLWVAFKGKSEGLNLILNIADIEQDPEEKDNKELESLSYNWDLE